MFRYTMYYSSSTLVSWPWCVSGKTQEGEKRNEEIPNISVKGVVFIYLKVHVWLAGLGL